MTAGAILWESGRLMVRRPWLLVLAAVVVVPLDVLDYVTSSWFLGLASSLADLITRGAVAALALAMLAGREADTVAALRVALRRAPVVFAATVVSLVGIVFGLLLFVVPGLVLQARWSVYLPVLINERVVGLGLGRSWRLVKGHSWVAFWATLVPALVFAAFVVTAFVFHGFAWHAVWITVHPLLLTYETIVAVVLYRWLVASSVAGEEKLGPDLDPHSPAYDQRAELGPRPYG